jgi:hypothetical protein
MTSKLSGGFKDVATAKELDTVLLTAGLEGWSVRRYIVLKQEPLLASPGWWKEGFAYEMQTSAPEVGEGLLPARSCPDVSGGATIEDYIQINNLCCSKWTMYLPCSGLWQCLWCIQSWLGVGPWKWRDGEIALVRDPIHVFLLISLNDMDVSR